jgi:hypothetical protein
LDTTESDSASVIRVLTTRFDVIKGQFMNRVTGVKEGTGESSDSFIFCSRNINIIHNDKEILKNEIFEKFAYNFF